MRCHFPRRRPRTGESGYALMVILFLLALLVLSTVAVAPTVLSSIQREKEAEMVWRGKQYVRGIRMYYVKMHRFPTSLDDLTKPKTGLRFMRQAYKDPMNPQDGSWRLIYVGPNGQLIGSLKNRSIGATGQIGTPAGQAGTAFGSNSGFANNAGGNNPGFGNNSGFGSNSAFGGNSGFGSNSSFGNSGFGNSNFSQSSFGTSGFSNSSNSGFGSNSNQPGTTSGAFSTAPADNTSNDPNDPSAANVDNGVLPPGAMADTPTIVGGNIIGVGSKVNKKSFEWYDKAKNYRLFEFIWDPSKDFTIGGASQGIGTPLQSTGQPNSPFSQGTGPGQTPSQNPQQNSQQNQNFNNPNPDPNQNPPLQAPPPSNP
jgi:hypothetical protein